MICTVAILNRSCLNTKLYTINDDSYFVLDKFVELASSDESSLQTLSQQTNRSSFSNIYLTDPPISVVDPCEDGLSKPKKKRGTVNIMNEKVVAVLYICKLSNREAVHLIATILQASNVDLESYIVNITSFHRYRQVLRAAKAEHIKKVFKNRKLSSAVIHWDGKLLPNALTREVTDRLPVLITSGNVEKLLAVAELEDGKGITQAKAIYKVLDDWGLSENVEALCCDTTPSNLGCSNGAAFYLEQLLEKNLLYLSCRHHILELVLRCVFEKKIPFTTGPNVPLFKKIQSVWPDIKQNNYKSGIENQMVRNIVIDHIEDIKSFVKATLQQVQPRDDYRELLELTLIFIGIVPPRGVKFSPPGAYHHARWMSKAIYSLKIYLFREQFQLTKKQTQGIAEVCIFIVIVYVKGWFTAPLANRAPNHDFQFLKRLDNYKLIDLDVSQEAVLKFKNHLWYLNPEAVALSFFDDELEVEVKRKMVEALNTVEEDTTDRPTPKRIDVKLKDISHLCNQDLDYFVSVRTFDFFKRFNIDSAFLTTDPSLWSMNKSYQNGLEIVKNLTVVNDVAERAVHLVEEYNNILTNDNDQKQYILQILTEYRKVFPDARKQTVMKNF